MIKIIMIILVSFFFFSSPVVKGQIYDPEGSISVESMNQTGVKDNAPKIETGNYNLLIGRLKLGAKIKNLDPTFGIVLEVRMDQTSLSGSAGFGFALKSFSIYLSAGKNFYRKDASYRDENAKDQENFGAIRMWTGFKHFEAVVYASGNTNSLKEFYGKMLVRPVPYIGIGIMAHKTHPKLFKVFGYGEVTLPTKFFMLKLFGGIGGLGENGKVQLTAMFGGKIDINFLSPLEKKKKK